MWYIQSRSKMDIIGVDGMGGVGLREREEPDLDGEVGDDATDRNKKHRRKKTLHRFWYSIFILYIY